MSNKRILTEFAVMVLIILGLFGFLSSLSPKGEKTLVLVPGDYLLKQEVQSWCEGTMEECDLSNFHEEWDGGPNREVTYIKPDGREYGLEPKFNIPPGFVAVYTDESDKRRIREYICWGPDRQTLVPGSKKLKFYRQGTYLLLRKDNPVSSKMY